MPTKAEERHDKIDFLVAVAKKNDWSKETPDVFGKLLLAAKKLWPEYSEQTQKSYAESALNYLTYKKGA